MPAKSAAQYGLAQAVAHSSARGSSMPMSVAKRMIAHTPGKMRSRFAAAIQHKRKHKAPTRERSGTAARERSETAHGY